MLLQDGEAGIDSIQHTLFLNVTFACVSISRPRYSGGASSATRRVR